MITMKKTDRAFAKELGECAGKWVATDDKSIIVCGKTIAAVRKKAKAKHIENPRIFAVPDPKKGKLFL